MKKVDAIIAKLRVYVISLKNYISFIILKTLIDHNIIVIENTITIWLNNSLQKMYTIANNLVMNSSTSHAQIFMFESHEVKKLFLFSMHQDDIYF